MNSVKIWADLARISMEAQMVIGLRTAGMMGFVGCPKGETTRMIIEKQEAALSSIRGATRAAMTGQSTEQIVDAAIRPYGRRTYANAKRLMRAAWD